MTAPYMLGTSAIATEWTDGIISMNIWMQKNLEEDMF
jgi:hypothetical protein